MRTQTIEQLYAKLINIGWREAALDRLKAAPMWELEDELKKTDNTYPGFVLRKRFLRLLIDERT